VIGYAIDVAMAADSRKDGLPPRRQILQMTTFDLRRVTAF